MPLIPCLLIACALSLIAFGILYFFSDPVPPKRFVPFIIPAVFGLLYLICLPFKAITLQYITGVSCAISLSMAIVLLLDLTFKKKLTDGALVFFFICATCAFIWLFSSSRITKTIVYDNVQESNIVGVTCFGNYPYYEIYLEPENNNEPLKIIKTVNGNVEIKLISESEKEKVEIISTHIDCYDSFRGPDATWKEEGKILYVLYLTPETLHSKL